jgi:hypothetical protein
MNRATTLPKIAAAAALAGAALTVAPLAQATPDRAPQKHPEIIGVLKHPQIIAILKHRQIVIRKAGGAAVH